VNQLVGLPPAAFKERVVLRRTCSGVNAGEIEVFVSLELVEGFVDQLPVLGTDARKFLQKERVDVAFGHEL